MKSMAMALLGGTLLLGAPSAASAQAYITPFIGGNFGGDTGVSLDESINDTSKLDFGVKLGAMSHGIFGGEVDFGYTPNFYGKGSIFDSSSVLSFMGNILIGVPAGPVRVYGLVGLGLLRRSVAYVPTANQPNVTESQVAYDLGGGVNIFFSKHVGINGDLRYFRNFGTGNEVLDLPREKFNYARGTVGVAFRF